MTNSDVPQLVYKKGGSYYDIAHRLEVENSDDEVDERTSDENLRDLDIKVHERAPLAGLKHFYQKKHSKNKGLVAETYVWDEEEVTFDDEEMVEVRVLMALSEKEKLNVRKNHARNSKWVNITMRKVNILLSMDEDANW
ncbi:hypothetical protein Tco_1232756 [Tanacetum coccineum]